MPEQALCVFPAIHRPTDAGFRPWASGVRRFLPPSPRRSRLLPPTPPYDTPFWTNLRTHAWRIEHGATGGPPAPLHGMGTAYLTRTSHDGKGRSCRHDRWASCGHVRGRTWGMHGQIDVISLHCDRCFLGISATIDRTVLPFFFFPAPAGLRPATDPAAARCASTPFPPHRSVSGPGRTRPQATGHRWHGPNDPQRLQAAMRARGEGARTAGIGHGAREAEGRRLARAVPRASDLVQTRSLR